MKNLFSWFGERSGRNAERRDASPGDLRRMRTTLRDALEGIGGEASARERLVAFQAVYRSLNDSGRRELLSMLAREFNPDPGEVSDAVRAYFDVAETDDRRAAENRLRLALASPRIRILKQFNLLPDGVKFLVDLRADCLRHLRERPSLTPVEEELQSLFSSWFDVGFLELARIGWTSSAALLEKLIAYEAVHEIRSWNDLRNRLDSDRRCYAFFHHRMPGEPLIFVEVALVKGMASNVHSLLDESAPAIDPNDATAAIFYSISSTQAGLKGISFGGFLIKRVVEELLHDFPRLKTFATLSPIPGFRRWLDAQLKVEGRALLGGAEAAAIREASGVGDAGEGVRALLAAPDWHSHPAITGALEPALTRLVACYLAEEKEAERPIDTVARFHLGNGARLERINWLADTSPRGLKQSAGLMVNYLYKLDEIEANHEAFARDGAVAMSDRVKRLLRRPR